MILFAFEAFQAMGVALAKFGTLGHFQVARFENGELHAGLQTAVRSESCFVLGSIAPPDEQLLSVLLLAHTLRKEGARRVTALLPYLAYARDDKDKPGESSQRHWPAPSRQPLGLTK